MIIKIIDYGFEAVGTVHRSAASRKALMAGLAVGSYVLELDANAVVEGATSELPENLSRYLTNDVGKVERVRDSKIFNLPGDTVEEQIIAFGFLIATYGIDSLRQIVFSYGPGSVTPEMVARHCDLLLKILGAKNYPAIYAMHGDTDYDHGHLALCLVDIETGKRGDWAQGFEIEALHIAAAICVYQDQLEAEPNRRYVADETGVYHTWSGIRVGDADGTIPKRGVFKKIHVEQIAFEKAVKPGPGFSAGEALSTPEAVRLLARGAVRKVKSWEALHRSLARVGLRYEPYIADGEIEGGYIVPNLALVDDAHLVKGSDVNAGYGRLVERLRGEYQSPPPGLKVRPFLHPTYRGLDDEETEEESAQSLKREQSAKLEEEIDELAAHLKRARERQDEDERLAADAEKAKLEKDRSAKLAVHNARQRAQKARREADEELLAGLKVSAQQSGAKSKRGRRTKAKPIPGVFWGDPDPKNQAAADWRQRYVIETNGPKRTYSVNQAPAFVETKNFVAMHTHDRQAAMDGLRCAHEKFGTVKITGTPQFRREMILLALEMEIPLDIRHTFEARKLRKQVAEAKEKADREAAEKADKVIYEANASTHRANLRASQRDDPKGVERKRRHAQYLKLRERLRFLKRRQLQGRKERAIRARDFNSNDIDLMRHRNSCEAEGFRYKHEPNPEPNEALRLLTQVDRDTLMLASSLYSRDGVSFLDDEALVRALPKRPRYIVLPEVQQHLAAIAAIQREQRKWIAAGMLQKRIRIRNDAVEVNRNENAWAVRFWDAQKGDPTFRRLMFVALIRPDRFASNPDCPFEAAACIAAVQDGDLKLARAIVDNVCAEADKHGNAVANSKDKTFYQTVHTTRTTVMNEAAKDYRMRILQPVFMALDNEQAKALIDTQGWQPYNHLLEARRIAGDARRAKKRGRGGGRKPFRNYGVEI